MVAGDLQGLLRTGWVTTILDRRHLAVGRTPRGARVAHLGVQFERVDEVLES